MGSIIAYLRTVPPVDQEWSPKHFTLLGNVLIGLGVFDSFMMADQIDHTGPVPAAPPREVSHYYGEYLVRTHGLPAVSRATTVRRQS